MGLERIRKTSACASTGSATPAPGFPGVPEALGEEEAHPCPRANPAASPQSEQGSRGRCLGGSGDLRTLPAAVFVGPRKSQRVALFS